MPIIERSNRNYVIAFDSHLKIALKSVHLRLRDEKQNN